jgi:cellulose synthase/poly-beta-1,6-N-acetylglucosamine synthase-like glycosyltransferase
MTIFIIISSLFSLFYLYAIFFLYRGLHQLSRSAAPVDHHNHSFSIVIAARDEESNIAACLESVLSQTIESQRYEVILIDDRSRDGTNEAARGIAHNHGNLTVLSVTHTPSGWSPKKYAVSRGIAAARNEVIVFTDADCRAPATWLEAIDKRFDARTGLVQGITAYRRPAGMNKLFFGIQALDFLSHGIVAAAAIGAGFPLNSNANNLAFRKSAFTDCGGYGGAGSVVSGDDDLLLQRIYKSKKWRVRYMTDPRGAVETFPAPTVKAVFEQRKRWGSKTVHYNTRQVIFLGGIFCFYCSLLVGCIAAAAFPGLWLAVGLLFMIKSTGEAALLIPGTALFNKKELRPFIPFASLLHLPMVIAAVVTGVFGKFGWKGQTFKRTMETPR